MGPVLRSLFARAREAARRLAADSGGAILVQTAIVLPALFGFALLAIDVARLYNLHTSLQSAADALALAGAAELDRRSDSITRANRAIDNVVRNDQRFGDGAAQIGRAGISVRFLSSLPANDSQAVTASYETTDPTATHFVEVSIRPVTFNSLLPASLVNAVGSTQSSATAVAGFDQAVCNFAPVFICNPFEGTSTSLFDAVRDPSWRRRLMALRQIGGTSSQYFPGNYGFLEPPTNPGAAELRDMLAVDRPRACFLQNGVLLRTGYVASANDALNVRFDLYNGSLNGKKSDPSYRPAQNVRKGYSGNGCSQQPQTDPNIARGLTRDTCFANSSCPTVSPQMAGRIGDGNWDFDGYWRVNFGASRAKPTDANGRAYSNNNPPSRYDIYRYEIDNNLVPVRSGPTNGHNANQGEVGTPQCYGGGSSTLNDRPDRRLLTGAVLNCRALDQQYNISGGSAPPLPAAAFARFFITEPVDQSTDQTIWAELVDLIEPGTPDSNSIIRDIVQLYR